MRAMDKGSVEMVGSQKKLDEASYSSSTCNTGQESGWAMVLLSKFSLKKQHNGLLSPLFS